MTSLESQSVKKRLERVEKTNRLMLAAWIALASVWLLAATQPQSPEPARLIRAETFELVDEQEKVLARWSSDSSGVQISLSDSQGRSRLRLSQSQDETGLFVLDETGDTRIGIAQFGHGGGGVALHGPGAKGAAVLYLKENGSLTFYDEAGKVIDRTP